MNDIRLFMNNMLIVIGLNKSKAIELNMNFKNNTKIKTNTFFKQHYNHVHMNLRLKLIGCYYCDVKVPPHLRAFHLEEMHDIPAPTCNACGKKFARPCEVLRHQQICHMGEKKYVCDVCNMTFATRNSLRQHVIKHSTARNFKCDYCEKAFKWRKHLRRHVMLHMKRQN